MNSLRLTETLKFLLISLVVVFVVQQGLEQFAGVPFKSMFGLVPSGVFSGKLWQFVTYPFLHADLTHLLLNGLVLAFMGPDLEFAWGRKTFLKFLGFCSVFAGVFYVLLQTVIANPMFMNIPLVGASGGIYGLLLAYAILFPEREMLFMMVFPLKAKQFVGLLIGVEFLTAVFSGQGGLGAIAHLSGMGAGYLWLKVGALKKLKLTTRSGPKKPRASHLKLVTRNEKEDKKTWH